VPHWGGSPDATGVDAAISTISAPESQAIVFFMTVLQSVGPPPAR
jgi:hypothetical protein